MIRKSTIVGMLLMTALCSVVLAQTRVTPHSLKLSQGSAVEGRADFVKLRCDSCQSVYREPRGRLPLRDLSHETPQGVAAMILERTDLAPQAYFDEMVMSAAASNMTLEQLANIVAYLRHPEAAKDNR